jgi:hypothetical protein
MAPKQNEFHLQWTFILNLDFLQLFYFFQYSYRYLCNNDNTYDCAINLENNESAQAYDLMF